MAYTIRFDDKTNDHFARLTARQRATVLERIEHQLRHQPAFETRHRKRMHAEKPGFIAPWELRITGNLRVYYDVQDGPPQTVLVVAVGIKLRNRLRIGDLEIEAS